MERSSSVGHEPSVFLGKLVVTCIFILCKRRINRPEQGDYGIGATGLASVRSDQV